MSRVDPNDKRSQRNSALGQADYIDTVKDETYDLLGDPEMIPYWNNQRSNFFSRIDHHTLVHDHTVIDLTAFPQQIKQEIANYVLTLPQQQRNKIIPLGF